MMVMKFKVAFHNKNLIYKMYKKCEPKYYSASMKTNNILFDKKQIDYQQYINSMNEMVNLKLKGSLNQANTNLPEQIQENIIDQYSKFAMPIGWGWTYPFIKYTTAILIFAKTSMNISWLSFFALSGIIIRVLMLPFLIKQVILVHKQAKVSSHIKLIGHATFGSKLKFYLKIKYFLKAVFQYSSSVKVNPVVLVAYNLFQIPIFFLMIFSIRKISFDENLINEGVLWFRNLNEPDPYMVLPIVSVLMTYYNLGVKILNLEGN